MAWMSKANVKRSATAGLAGSVVLGTIVVLGAVAGPAHAQPYEQHYRYQHREYRHNWNGGYYRRPPVVYSPGYYYYPPPVVYGPGFGLNFDIR